jgi:hypothetical protein
MFVREGEHILFGELDSPDDALLLMSIKMMAGWEVVSLPFGTNYEMVDVGEETTEAVPRNWCIIMHRRPVRQLS